MHTRSGAYGMKRKGMAMEVDRRGKKKKKEAPVEISDDESSPAKRGKMKTRMRASSSGLKKKKNRAVEKTQRESGKVRTRGPHLPDPYITRKIVFGRFVDLKFFDANGFQNFRRWFRHQSLIKFVQIKEFQYSRLVREFYSNMVVTDVPYIPMLLTTTVKGKSIEITSSLLHSVFSCPNIGFSDYQTHSWIELAGFNSQVAGQLLTGREDVPEKYKPRARELTLEFKLFHNMLIHVFLPRSGGRDHVTFFDVFFMWAVATGLPISFPHFMLKIMSEVKKSSIGILPYGMALTKIFKYFEIDLSDEKEIERIKGTDIYSEGTLDRFRYEKEEECWVKKTMTKADKKKAIAAGKQKRGETSSREGNIGPATSPSSQPQPLTLSASPSPALAPSNLLIMEMLMKMQDNINLLMAQQAPAASTSAPSDVTQEIKEMKEALKLLQEQHSLTSSSKAHDFTSSSAK